MTEEPDFTIDQGMVLAWQDELKTSGDATT